MAARDEIELPCFAEWFRAEFGGPLPDFLRGLELVQLGPGLWANNWPIAELCGFRNQSPNGVKVMLLRRPTGGWAFLYVDGRISLSLRSTPSFSVTEEARLFLNFLRRCADTTWRLDRLGIVRIRGSEDSLRVTLWPDVWNDRDLYCCFQGEDSRSFWSDIAEIAAML